MKEIDFERELARHSESTLRAIDSGRIDLAKRRLTAYPKFATTFLEAAAERGVFFSDESTPSISFLDWPTPLQIANYAKRGAMAAVGTQNSELVSEGAYLPVHFLELSVTHSDFLFYTEMSRLYPRILSLAYESPIAGTTQQIMELSWRPISEFCRYRLVPLLRDRALDKASGYISQTLGVFSDLMNVAMNHSDPETFILLGREMDRLFETLAIHPLPNDALRDLIHSERNERLQIWFESGARATHGRVMAEGSPEPLPPEREVVEESQIDRFFNEAAKRFHTLGDLSGAYFQSLHRDSSGALWRRWVRESLTDGRPRRDVFDRLQNRFYCLAGIGLVMAGKSDPISPHRETRFRKEAIDSVLNEVRQSPERWTKFLPAVETVDLSESSPLTLEWATERFSQLYDSAIRQWDLLREEQILEASIDPSRKESFREDCFAAWRHSGWLLSLFHQNGQVRSEQAEPNAEYVVIHSLLPKEAFIADQDTMFFGLGQSAGIRLAGEATKDILADLETACVGLERAKIETAAAEVLPWSYGMKHPVVILVGNLDIQEAFSDRREFVSSWSDPNPEFSDGAYIGRLGKAPVFHVFNSNIHKVLIVDLAKVGTLVHYRPLEHEYKGLKVRVDAISKDGAEELYRSYPDIKPESSSSEFDSDRGPEEIIRWLMLQVDVTVGIKLGFEKLNPEPGIVVPITLT